MVWHHQCTNSTTGPRVQGLQDHPKNAFGTLQKTSRGSSPESCSDIYQLNYTDWELSVYFGQSAFKGHRIGAQSCIPHTCTHSLHAGMMADKESFLWDTGDGNGSQHQHSLMVLLTFLAWLARQQTKQIKGTAISTSRNTRYSLKILDSAEHYKNLQNFRYAAINCFS